MLAHAANIRPRRPKGPSLSEYICDDNLNYYFPAHVIEMSFTDDTNPDATINALKRRVNTLEETVCRAKDHDTSTTSPS